LIFKILWYMYGLRFISLGNPLPLDASSLAGLNALSQKVVT